ncbi:membrane protein, partial [Mycobacterium rhizamassiliense]
VRSPKALLRLLIHGRSDEPLDTRPRAVLRWVRIMVLIVTGLITLQSVLLVAGAWRDDLAIQRNKGVAQAEVLSAGPRRSTIEFVTPERVTYRPELGVLYPSELSTGMRIYVEYNKNNPNLVRVQHRTAGLAIIPAGSIAVVAWLVAVITLVGLALLDKRLDRRAEVKNVATESS